MRTTIDFEDEHLEVIKKAVRLYFWTDNCANSGHKNVARDIMHTLGQFLAVQNNNGFFDNNNSDFRDPLHTAEIPLPHIHKFSTEMTVWVDKEDVCRNISEAMRDKKPEKAMQIAKEYLGDKLPDGESQELKPFYQGTAWAVIVEKPQK